MTELEDRLLDPLAEFDDPEKRLLASKILRGDDVKAFLNSGTGQYLLMMAKQDMREVQQQLVTVPPWRKRKIQALQGRHAAIVQAIQWLAEMVRDGSSAERQLEAGDADPVDIEELEDSFGED